MIFLYKKPTPSICEKISLVILNWGNLFTSFLYFSKTSYSSIPVEVFEKQYMDMICVYDICMCVYVYIYIWIFLIYVCNTD